MISRSYQQITINWNWDWNDREHLQIPTLRITYQKLAAAFISISMFSIHIGLVTYTPSAVI